MFGDQALFDVAEVLPSGKAANATDAFDRFNGYVLIGFVNHKPIGEANQGLAVVYFCLKLRLRIGLPVCVGGDFDVDGIVVKLRVEPLDWQRHVFELEPFRFGE